MRNITLILGLFFSAVSIVASTGNSNDTIKCCPSEATEIDQEVSVKARIIEGKIFFSLSMLNESKEGFYSLVRTFPDGSFESVGIKDIAVNKINKPLLYSFVEEQVPEVNVIYELFRVTSEGETVETWQYCSEKGMICDCELFTAYEE